MDNFINVHVKKSEKNFTISIYDDLIANPEKYMNIYSPGKTMIIVTPSVYFHYRKFIDELSKCFVSSILEVICIKEHNKDLFAVSYICNLVNNLGFGKNDIFISVCGGCCQDVVTTAAALYKRGIRVIRIPTTLIGAVDAGIGIKSSLNIGAQKSTVGTFYHPYSVLIDLNFLHTLPSEYMICGLAEIIKIGIILDADLFNLIENNSEKLLQCKYYTQPSSRIFEIIYRAINGMVSQLEINFYEDISFERLMDFGHTFSNVLESDSLWTIPHGFAVSIDIALSLYLSYRFNLLSYKDLERSLNVLINLGLPIFSKYLTQDSCLRALKKAILHRGGEINLVIPTAIGKGTFIKKIDDNLLNYINDGLTYLSDKPQKLLTKITKVG